MNSDSKDTHSIDLFLHNYELNLKEIYITAYLHHGKGILVVDINNNNNNNCTTKYISITEHEPFWNDIKDIKEKIIKNNKKMAYFYLIDNRTSVVLEREYE